MVVTETSARGTIVTLSPHLSATWPENKRFLLLLATAVFAVAAGWSAAGLWLVLPFAGLEFGLVTYFMYRVCYRLSYLSQQIIIEPQRVVIRRGIKSAQREWILTRPQAHLHVNKPVNDFHLALLWLKDDQLQLPVADFLNAEGREQARHALLGAGLVETSDRWWETGR
ncbi:hypothetical protein CEK62_07890 [Alcanivorax sp. N3-2A]|nr:hypothetical protein CEK62_07890 [Alcanivorax sp. N3-2A]|tara:strand:+ start:5480 stop:5986 length:507 start_codon:yes stop_codon:yes gene_type:complete